MTNFHVIFDWILYEKSNNINMHIIFNWRMCYRLQSQGMSGGFSETQLDTNVYTVRFSGNGYTSPSKAADFALLRSAEITLMRGATNIS